MSQLIYKESTTLEWKVHEGRGYYLLFLLLYPQCLVPDALSLIQLQYEQTFQWNITVTFILAKHGY